jgi:hypothetical protein
VSEITILTKSGPMVVLLPTDDATAGTSIGDPADTLADPATAAGVIAMGRSALALGHSARNALKFRPFGTGAAGNSFLMSVFAVERILGAPLGKSDQWTYGLLAALTCALSTKPGVALGPVDASHRYCDTIALTAGNASVSVEVVSPTNNQAAHALVDCKGAELVAVKFALNASASGANTLFGTL